MFFLSIGKQTAKSECFKRLEGVGHLIETVQYMPVLLLRNTIGMAGFIFKPIAFADAQTP